MNYLPYEQKPLIDKLHTNLPKSQNLHYLISLQVNLHKLPLHLLSYLLSEHTKNLYLLILHGHYFYKDHKYHTYFYMWHNCFVNILIYLDQHVATFEDH
jgi:hypothetical protein